MSQYDRSGDTIYPIIRTEEGKGVIVDVKLTQHEAVQAVNAASANEPRASKATYSWRACKMDLHDVPL